MQIMARRARGIAAALVGAGALAAGGCGEVQGTPEGSPPQVQQETASLDCATAIAPERELVIQDVGVLNDSSPFTKTWDSTGKSGTHVIVAVASDRAGNIRRSTPVTVTVP